MTHPHYSRHLNENTTSSYKFFPLRELKSWVNFCWQVVPIFTVFRKV